MFSFWGTSNHYFLYVIFPLSFFKYIFMYIFGTYQPDLTCATILDIFLFFVSSLWHVAWVSCELDLELWNFKLWPLLLICILFIDNVGISTLDDGVCSSPGRLLATDLHSLWCLFIHSGNEQTELSFCTATHSMNLQWMLKRTWKANKIQ